MFKIKEYIGMSSDYKFLDVIRIINVCAKHNIEITFAEAEELWSKYSDDYCAQWLGLPDSDEYLFEIIIEQAKMIWKLEDKGVKYMSAKEMFKKLRFEYSLSKDKTIIKYELGLQRIWFDKDFKDIVINNVYVIKQELLQAINKQVEELGWNER